jgi:hypothetical protein
MDNREKQAAFKARMREKGFVLVADWIPATQRETFKAYAKALREQVAADTSVAPDDTQPKRSTGDPVTSNYVLNGVAYKDASSAMKAMSRQVTAFIRQRNNSPISVTGEKPVSEMTPKEALDALVQAFQPDDGDQFPQNGKPKNLGQPAVSVLETPKREPEYVRVQVIDEPKREPEIVMVRRVIDEPKREPGYYRGVQLIDKPKREPG